MHKNDLRTKDKKRYAAYLIIALVLLLIPTLITDGYHLRIVNSILIYCIIAVSINLVGGYGGHLAMGHACYVGIAAYTTAILSTSFGWPFLVTLPLSILAATLFGFITSFVCVGRIKGDYVMIITMGVSEITRIFIVNSVGLTGGPMGIAQIPAISIFSFTFTSTKQYYYLFLFFLLLTIFVIRSIVNSKFGRAVVAIREDEIAAKAMGINVNWNKILTFTISTVFAGLAGALFAHFSRFVGPMQFDLDEGLLYYQMIIIGGLGSIPGSILGAGILVLIPEIFRGISVYRTIVFGLIMVIMMIVRPQGLLGDVNLNHAAVKYGGALKGGLGRLIKRKGAER